MTQPIKLRIDGLFGHLTHEIALRSEDRVTIITGPNGAGKTHALNVLKALVGLDFVDLFGMPIASAEVKFVGGAVLAAKLSDDHEELQVWGRHSSKDLGTLQINRSDTPAGLPPWLEQVGPDRWFDSRDGRAMSTDILERRYGIRLTGHATDLFEEHAWLNAFRPPATPIMIATGRLDVRWDWEDARREIRRRPEAVARIVQYAETIQTQINDARRASLLQSQRSDRGFAVRALDKARATVQEGELRARYERISELNQELHTNGLTEETVAVAIPAGRTNPTERRILNLFLDDWEEKLAPLIPIHEKLQLLKEIVGSKFSPKRLEIGSNGELRVVSSGGEQIGVELLSSGEQHLLALYAMLLFTADAGSLVLIDEPEISLHASWKHAFLTDMERVAQLNAFRVVLATHSTGIVNGRWDLVEEIGSGE